MTEKTNIVPVEEGDPIALITPQELQSQIAVETEKRKILAQYIAKHLKRGVDYGKIHVVSKDKCQLGARCTNQYHWSKDVLFKPGAEKFCSLFRLRAEFTRDQESWEMLGSVTGLACYVCRLYTVRGILVGEGKGAASISEKGSPNVAIKIAKKRAMLDAVLTTGGLSDFFTQDLEDEHADETPQGHFEQPKPKPKDEAKLKNKIALLVKTLMPNITSTKKAFDDAVLDLADLAMQPENYEEIIGRLSVLIEERKQK